jgi:GT2 family glycosyltransferase
MNVNMDKPTFLHDNIFNWIGQSADFGYPMSVDGHIFKTIDIFSLIENLDYYNPNTFEAQLNSKICKNDKCFISIDNKSKMSCNKTSIIFNYPINRVQDTYKNKHAGSFHQKEMNQMYLKHIEIDQKSFENILPRSPHEEVDLYFTCGVSILMPLYNGFEFIDESVGSIINQTHYNWELIIGVNGYKEDDKIYNQVLQKYSNNNKIKILNFTKTNGKSETLNEMIKYCDYEWISLLDVDYKWEPCKLERQMKYIGKYDIIGSGCYYIIKNKISGKPNICYGEIDKSVFKTINPIINSSCLFMKKDAYWDPTFKIIEDYELWSRLNSQGKKFYNINEFLVYHRLHSKSYFNTQSHTKNYQDILTLIKNKYN